MAEATKHPVEKYFYFVDGEKFNQELTDAARHVSSSTRHVKARYDCRKVCKPNERVATACQESRLR